MIWHQILPKGKKVLIHRNKLEVTELMECCALSCENMSLLLYIQFLALFEGNLQKVGKAPCHVRVSQYCLLNLHLLCETGAIHISFYFSLEEYEEALKVNVLFDFFQYIHPSPIKIGVAEKWHYLAQENRIAVF